MPAKKQGTVRVACPHCGHAQTEPTSGYSTNCKRCGQYFRVQEALKPASRAVEKKPGTFRVNCLDCGRPLAVPVGAQSSMCKHCGAYLDLRDYQITNAVSRNFKTAGLFSVEPKGYIFNTECVVDRAIIKGRFIGRLTATGSLTIYSNASIKGVISANRLIIPAGEHFRWEDSLEVNSADISGELATHLVASEQVTLRSSSRFFGQIEARSIKVETGAIVVGDLKIDMGLVQPPVARVTPTGRSFLDP